MVIITGLGRCGTSILTKYLKEVGFGIGKNVNWHGNVRAGYELSTFYTLVHDLYHRFCKVNKPIDLDIECWGDYWKGYTYREALNKVDKDERQGKVDLVKDPRITWHPDIIESIWKVRKDIKLIICHRKIESIYNSRKSLPIQYDDPKPRHKLEEYKQDFADFTTKVLELGIPHIFLYFPNFLKDTGDTFMKLNNFIGLYDTNANVLNGLVDKELINGT
jgi:hypothetical protein